VTIAIHILLISAQAAPNVLPVLDPALKPGKAVLVVTQKMRRQADALQAVLIEAGVRVERVALTDEHDFSRMQEALMEVAAQHEGAGIALNLTGGTKLMALAAQSVAIAAGWKMFYVDLDTDEVIWLGDNAAPRQKLGVQLRLAHYLRAYGYNPEGGVDRPMPVALHNDLLDTLVSQVGSLEQPLGKLNYLAQQAQEQGRLDVKMTHEQAGNRELDALLRNFQDAAVLKRSAGDVIHFASKQDLAFAKGGWLEQHVFRVVTALHGALGLRDKAANLVVADATGVRNEMDVAFMARNRLFVIECKTARMDSGVYPKANDTLFKLAEVCRRVGGLGTRAMLASYRPVRGSEKKLAQALGVELVCGAELARLRERITQWVRPVAQP
jgi:hypothetical protein